MSDEVIPADPPKEPDIFGIMASLELPNFKTVLEIGVADGEDTPKIVEALKFSDGQYYAFEPEPANLTSLKERPEFRKHNFHVLPVAIGNATRRAIFHQSKGTTQSGSLKHPVKHLDVHPWCTFETTITVPMARLDDVASVFSIREVSFIWSDIQGAEDWLIAGGKATLSRTRYFYTEYNDEELYSGQLDAEDILSRLPGKWSIVHKWTNDVLFRNDSGFES